MARWVDLAAHGAALQVRQTADGRRELVVVRVGTVTDLPDSALQALGFTAEGEIYVRQDARFTLAEMQRAFPRAVAADIPAQAIAYAPPSSAPPLAKSISATSDTRADEPPPEWGLVPRPRFLAMARTQVQDGGVVIALDGKAIWRPDVSARAVAGAVSSVHRDAVVQALRQGLEPGFAVLVDYRELAFAGQPRQAAAARIMKLLSQLGITEKLMEGDEGYCVLKNDPFMDLVVERLLYPDGQRLVLTHYREVGGDKVLDAELVFRIRGGRLYLKETAVENVLRGGEFRGCDVTFANMFARNLLRQGFGAAAVVWPNDPAPNHASEPAQPESIDPPPGVRVVSAAGLVAAYDERPEADNLSVVVEASAAAALDALQSPPEPPVPVPATPKGMNLFGHVVMEEDGGRRYLRTPSGARIDVPPSIAGLESETEQEGLRNGSLLAAPGTTGPLAGNGEACFGRTVAACWHDDAGRIQVCAVEKRNGAYHGLYLAFNDEGQPEWRDLGKPWPNRPYFNELRHAFTHRVEAGFDALSLLEEVNASIEAANVEMLTEHHHLQPIDPETVRLAKVGHNAYEVRSAEPGVPLPVIRVQEEKLGWKAEVVGQSSRSVYGSLETSLSWAARELETQRRWWLTHVHVPHEGLRRVGVDAASFATIRYLLDAAADGAPRPFSEHPWEDLGVSDSDLSIKPEDVAYTVDYSDAACPSGVLQMSLRDVPDAVQYRVFMLEDRLKSGELKSGELRAGVSGLLRSMDRELAWERMLSAHPAADTLRAWLAFYTRSMVARHGPDHALPGDWSRGLVLALYRRDLPYLLRVIGDSAGDRNRCTKALFEHATGLSLGSSRKTREAAVYTYCGFTPEQAAADAARREERARMVAHEAEVRRLIERASNAKVRVDGNTVTVKDWIEGLLAQGYVHLDRLSTSGAVPRYWLYKHEDEGRKSGYRVSGVALQYARHVVAIAQSARQEPHAAPAPEERLQPAL